MKLKRISSMVLSAAVTAAMLAGSGTGAAVMAESTTESATQSAAGAAGSYTAGTYTGTAAGHNGDITVSVTFTDNAIASVEVTVQSETPTLSDKALTEIPQAIVDNQSLGVDTVSGATFTSRGIINAVADAVDQAGGDSLCLQLRSAGISMGIITHCTHKHRSHAHAGAGNGLIIAFSAQFKK